MKKLLVILMAILTFSIMTPVMADTASANTKIGIINLQDLLAKLPEMKQISDNLKKQFGDRETKLEQAQNQFKQDAENFRRNNAVMSAADKQTAEQKLAQQQQDLQQQQASFQKDFMSAQNQSVNTLLNKIKGVVESVATKGNYNLILVSSSVAYSSKDMDVTQDVLNQLQK
ncbi:MAG: OmpH family outer membrane protein [Gammaproteobacteria bacterium]